MTTQEQTPQLLAVPRVYVYDGFDHWLFDAQGARSTEYKAYAKTLKYSPCHGEFDLYIEPPATPRGCSCG